MTEEDKVIEGKILPGRISPRVVSPRKGRREPWELEVAPAREAKNGFLEPELAG
jgi:hypothetical protein